MNLLNYPENDGVKINYELDGFCFIPIILLAVLKCKKQ